MKGTIEKNNNNFDIIIIDAMNFAYKYYWVFKDFKDSKGNKTGMIYGIINFCRQLKKDYKGAAIVFAWDRKPEYKMGINKEYKANRVYEKKEGFDEQREKIQELLSMYGVFQLFADGMEADDVAAKYVKENIGKKILLISSDNDWDAMLYNSSIKIMRNNKIYSKEEIESGIGMSIEKICMYKAIIGEKKENINGIKRIPKKLVLGWVNEMPNEKIKERFWEFFNFYRCNRWAIEILKNIEKIQENYLLKSLITEGYEIQQIPVKINYNSLLKELEKYDMKGLIEKIQYDEGLI